MGSAREAAMLTLTACERQGAWSDGYLKKVLREQKLDRREAALAAHLSYGVLQNKLLLDWHLEAFSKSPLDKLDVRVLCNLRVALYQLLFLDKIPCSAAVNEAVELTKKHCRNPRAAGMVNGILRSVLRQEKLSAPDFPDKEKSLSIKYSHPAWLVGRFVAELGPDGAEALLAANNEQPPTTAQVNTLHTNFAELRVELQQAGVTARPHPWLTDCLLLSGTGNLERLPAFQQGKFYIQDAAARLAVRVANIAPGSRVLDCCAAPGGKSFAAAIDMKNQGQIISCDIHPHKIRLIEAGRNRLGLSIIEPQLQDATECQTEWLERFDVVLVDVPCSGLGIIRKKPDIRYKHEAAIDGLPRIQQTILDNCSQYVRRGGVLVYSTCTLLRQENEGVVEAFLKTHPQFCIESFDLPEIGLQPGRMTFWPHVHGTDGFFIAKLRREGGAV